MTKDDEAVTVEAQRIIREMLEQNESGMSFCEAFLLAAPGPPPTSAQEDEPCTPTIQ